MPTFQSRPLRKSNSLLARLTPKVRQRPLLFFGMPFMATMVAASFGLSMLTQTRYDYNATKVQTITKEDELRMRKDRKRIDIREEYFVSRTISDQIDASVLTRKFAWEQRLQSKPDELDDWEPIRVQRPAGVPEWGVPPTSSRSIETEGLTGSDADKERQSGISTDSIMPSRRRDKVILGPDGKPCRACNSKLAFSAAMKGGAAKDAKQTNSHAGIPAAAAVAVAGAALSQTECPPDGDELGRSTWTFLHSMAAYFPPEPSSQQQSSMLALLRALPDLYPCHSCAEALGEEYQREEREGGWQEKTLRLKQAVTSGSSLRKWLCGIHNEVNHRLGKPTFPCTEATLSQRWLEGPLDGSCS